MSGTTGTMVEDFFDDEAEFKAVLALAEENADTDWAETFVSQQRDRFSKYGTKMFLSDRQAEVLKKIAEGA